MYPIHPSDRADYTTRIWVLFPSKRLSVSHIFPRQRVCFVIGLRCDGGANPELAYRIVHQRQSMPAMGFFLFLGRVLCVRVCGLGFRSGYFDLRGPSYPLRRFGEWLLLF